MTDQGAAFALILMDALAHRRDCRHAEPGELLETLVVACFWESEAEGRDMSEWHEWMATKGVEVRSRAPACYVRRANNQVSAELEATIRSLLAHDWTKTAIARALRVNRRVVIRVSREAVPNETIQSAQCAGPRSPNGLGESQESESGGVPVLSAHTSRLTRGRDLSVHGDGLKKVVSD
jgi:hypothetical protein